MFLNPPQFILVFFIFCCYEQLKITSGLKCFSCFRSCRGHKSCDCTNGECSGQFCYARIVSYEGFHGVHKGCTSDNAGFLVPDNNCLLDRTDHSADCICDSNNFCNTKRLLRNAKKFLNSVKCCYHNIEVTDLATNTQKCGKVCKGTYCYDDRISDEKGCGHGRSELLRLLRIPTFTDLGNTSQQICAKITSNNEREVLIDGCVCTEKFCNKKDFLQTPMQVNSTKIFCHSCEVKENQSDTCGLGQKCTGDYCFVHFKSLQIAQYTDESDGSDGAPLQEYIRSYQYGCINTNRPELIRPGCNQEWEGENNSAESKLTAVECICDKSYCNTEPDHFGNLWIPTVDILEQENLLEFGSGMANFSATSPFNVPLEELGSGIEDLN